jgi:hypothetical protein
MDKAIIFWLLILIQELREEPINITLTENDVIEPIGHVAHIVDEFVVIQSKSGTSALDLESLLCLEDRTIIGRVRYLTFNHSIFLLYHQSLQFFVIDCFVLFCCYLSGSRNIWKS